MVRGLLSVSAALANSRLKPELQSAAIPAEPSRVWFKLPFSVDSHAAGFVAAGPAELAQLVLFWALLVIPHPVVLLSVVAHHPDSSL